MTEDIALADRFWSKVEKRADDECWPWLGTKMSSGYGHLRISGRNIRATHISWSIHHNAPWPEGKFGCHACDNPVCVNPAHIWPGTQAENMADMLAKGRRPSRYKRRTHCPRGHSYAEQAPYPHIADGRRNQCRICHNEARRKRREQQRRA